MITRLNKNDSRLVMAHMYVAIGCLVLGGLAGLLQTLVRSGYLQLPKQISYYQILTVHGIVLALVLTTFFILGFQFSAVAKTSGHLTSVQRKFRLGWILGNDYWYAHGSNNGSIKQSHCFIYFLCTIKSTCYFLYWYGVCCCR